MVYVYFLSKRLTRFWALDCWPGWCHPLSRPRARGGPEIKESPARAAARGL